MSSRPAPDGLAFAGTAVPPLFKGQRMPYRALFNVHGNPNNRVQPKSTSGQASCMGPPSVVTGPP